MPGPQFSDSANNRWLKRAWRPLAATLIVLLLVAGAVYFYQNYQKRIGLLEPALEKIIVSTNPIVSAPVTAAPNNQVKNAVAPEVGRDENSIIVTAAKGNGLTHLARQALKEYLKDKPELAQKLTAEHRIYIEDYLRKHITGQSKTLHAGDQLTFSDNDIQNAINAALALNDNQIKNLGQYVSLVPSLMTI